MEAVTDRGALRLRALALRLKSGIMCSAVGSPFVLRRAKRVLFSLRSSALPSVSMYASPSVALVRIFAALQITGDAVNALSNLSSHAEASVAARHAWRRDRADCLDLSYGGPALWPTDSETPAGEAVRPTHKALRCRAAARTPPAGDSARERCRASVGRPARAASATTLTRARAAKAQKADAAAALKKMPKRSALFSKTLMQAQKTRDGRTCSWCKLVGKRNLENVTLAPCGPCLRRRGVSVLYCSRKCQREAWQTHKPICAATPWSLQQHRFHGKGQREYVRRLVQDHLIHTLAWKREPSHASSLLTGRILPYLLSYAPPPPGWSRHWSPARPTVRAVAYVNLGADAGLRARIGERARRLARPRVALSVGRVDGRAGGVVGFVFCILASALPSASMTFARIFFFDLREHSSTQRGSRAANGSADDPCARCASLACTKWRPPARNWLGPRRPRTASCG